MGMVKKITCIECPKGCILTVDFNNRKVISVEGYECEKGEHYAISEIENPVRVITSTVIGVGLNEKMIPVRTNKPVPKVDMFRVMEEIRKVRVDKSIEVGDVIIEDILGLDVKLIATRQVKESGS